MAQKKEENVKKTDVKETNAKETNELEKTKGISVLLYIITILVLLAVNVITLVFQARHYEKQIDEMLIDNSSNSSSSTVNLEDVLQNKTNVIDSNNAK